MNYKTIAQETLNIEADTLRNAAKTLQEGIFEKAVEMVLECKGN